MTEACTRCKRAHPIRMRGTLEFDTPYALCRSCFDFYNSIIDDDHQSAAFAADLWRLAATQSVEMIRQLKPMGNA